MTNGFPLGITEEITHTGIFPATTTDSAAVEASRLEGMLQGDFEGKLNNYVSFEEAGQSAEDLLEEMRKAGRTEVFESWSQVVEKFGDDAVMTKLACITKLKESGELKHRLVVDCRKSGVNGLATVRERVILPKVTDFVKSVHRVASKRREIVERDYKFELFSTDFSNAFYMCPLRASERRYVVFKSGRGDYHVSKCVVFGLAAGPLLWARVASAAMRVAQAVMHSNEAAIACYVDDPLMAVLGPTAKARMRSFCMCTLVWQALGLDIAWHKGCHGDMVPWIGYEVSLSGRANEDVTVRMAENKRKKLQDTFEELLTYKGMLPLRLLQHATGVLGWASSILKSSRPWLAMLYAAATQHQRPEPIRVRARERKGLVFVKQVANALRWLNAMVQEIDAQRPGLRRTFKWRPDAPRVLIQTDACPAGMGGFLRVGQMYIAYWHTEVTALDRELMNSEVGDPSFQNEWELLTIWMSLEAFAPWLREQSITPQVLIRTDNTAALRAAAEYRAKSPILSQLAAEISFQVELMELLPLMAEHVAGIENDIADKLSRMDASSNMELPWQLRNAAWVDAPARQKHNFRAWP